MFQAVPPPIIRSTKLHTTSGIVKPILLPAAAGCMYSFVLLMMGGGTAWNM